jgi:SAM-dependent methyltransferase
LLEKIGAPEFATISQPNDTVLALVRGLMQADAEPVFYEIGVGIGATTLPVAEIMDNRGRIVLFSREHEVAELAADLALRGFTNIDAGWGSPAKVYSGYHFELARGFVAGDLPVFDLAYVDGGHVFHLDAPATAVLKELCKPGGYLVFDDWYWSIARSPTMGPSVREATRREYDLRQIEACHVQLVCKSIMDVDPRFEFIGLEGATAAYRRRGAHPA